MLPRVNFYSGQYSFCFHDLAKLIDYFKYLLNLISALTQVILDGRFALRYSVEPASSPFLYFAYLNRRIDIKPFI